MLLVNIVQGWYNAAKKDLPEHVRIQIIERASKCDTCPKKLEMHRTLGSIVGSLTNNDPNSAYYCGSCGCPLAGLLSSPKSSCKEEKWGPMTDESYF